MKSARSKKSTAGKHGPITTKAAQVGLTRAEIDKAETLIQRALRVQAIPVYSPEERFVLAILSANVRLLQRARGKKSGGAAKEQAAYRRSHVNILLRYVVEKRYSSNPTSLATVMKIVDWLDRTGIKASEPQVRRDIHAALKLGPLPTW